MLNPILYAVPVFLALMALEWWLARRRGVAVYAPADTVGSLSLGIVSQLVAVFTKLATLGLYSVVHEHAALWRLPVDSPAVWIGALLAYDLCYYWLHRLGHTVQILWAAHVVHHSSEHYNLSTALRQTGSGFVLGWVFYLPMAVVGVPPLVFAVVGLIDLLYQFWVHTRLVGRLGWFDRVFCSPSNHRVHHGQNDWCIDRNYGGILILWDRLFGSFADERPGEPIVYGVRGALRSFSPWRANLQVYAGMWRDWRLARTWADRLAATLGHGLTALVEVSLDKQGSEHLDAFEARAVAHDAVQQCWRVSPGPDFMLVVQARDMPDYLAISQTLFTQDANVRNVKAFFSVKRSKFGAELPLR